MSNLKLLQIFLSGKSSPVPSYAEVCVDDDDDFVCSCPGYWAKKMCKHIDYVEKKIKETSGGAYPLELVGDYTDLELERALSSVPEMNKFIRKYGSIEVY